MLVVKVDHRLLECAKSASGHPKRVRLSLIHKRGQDQGAHNRNQGSKAIAGAKRRRSHSVLTPRY